MCTVWISFVVWNHIWVAPMNVVHVIASVAIPVGTCARLLSQTLECSYQLWVFFNHNLLWYTSKIYQYRPQQLVRITLSMLSNVQHVLLTLLWVQSTQPPSIILCVAICITIALVCAYIVNSLLEPGVRWLYNFLGVRLEAIHTCHCKYPNGWIHFWRYEKAYTGKLFFLESWW